MSKFSLELPVIQKWNCHNCSDCCSYHAIEVTDQERERIIKQNWTQSDGIPEGASLFTKTSGLLGKKTYRLSHQENGACLFLDEEGLCRIHAKFGEHNKPLACRIYPYAFHPKNKKIVTSLRFSCPSVVKNLGQPLNEQKKEITKIAKLVVPESRKESPPPALSQSENIKWDDFLLFTESLDQILREKETSFIIKLLRCLLFVKFTEQTALGQTTGKQLKEFLEIITKAAISEIQSIPEETEEVSSINMTQFRLLVAQYARKDTDITLRGGWKSRLTLLNSALKFAKGKGNIPPLQDCFHSIPFEQIESSFGSLPEGVNELFTRLFRVKIQGMHFCGPAYYDVPFVEGFYSLAALYPATLWLARWLAKSDQRDSLELEDIQYALTIADHHHGYSPIFGTAGFRRRIKTLVKNDDLKNLCLKYS